MKHIINIDKNLCIGCGLCVSDCPQQNIFLDEEKKATLKLQDCIKCGHCVAVCPQEAVSMTGFDEPPAEIRGTRLNPDELLDAIKSRRSIRSFKEQKISREDIDMIIEAGRWTPTGKNVQNVSYVVIENEMEDVEKEAVKMFKMLASTAGLFSKALKGFEVDDHFFFKKAPVAIAVVCDDKVNGTLAASNMALMAEALGLGVLYSGFFSFAANKSISLKKKLNLKGKVVTTLVLGYPNINYKRGVQREKADVEYK